MTRERYSAEQFIKAMPGTGGIISAIAGRVGCTWHTARDYINSKPTVQRAWEEERHKVNDKAQQNIVVALHDGDLQTSKWWLQVMDEEFMPKQHIDSTNRTEITTIEIVKDYGKDGDGE